MNKKIFFVSLGCPKNLVDSEIMLYKLLKQKYTITDNPKNANLIIINTCAFINDALEESFENIEYYSKFKEENPKIKLIVTGCLSQRLKKT